MYILKQTPEDFIVIEENDFNLCDGKYSLIKLKKTNYDTIKALGVIANILHKPLKTIGFAGNKDKYAVTEQFITIENITKEKIESLVLKDIELTYIGQIKNRINLGDLKNNKFIITIRNLDSDFKLKTNDPKLIPNYFGEQRFSENNSGVGKFIIKNDFKSAVELILKGSGQAEEEIKEHLDENPNDYIGAFQKLPFKVQKLYVHAYQSDLWNQAVKTYLESHPKTDNIEIPIFGFETEFDNDDIEDIYDEILDKEDISQRDFIIRSIPNLTTEGTSRSIFMEVSEFSVSKLEIDELNTENKDKKKIRLEFKLNKGCYATTLIEYLFN